MKVLVSGEGQGVLRPGSGASGGDECDLDDAFAGHEGVGLAVVTDGTLVCSL